MFQTSRNWLFSFPILNSLAPLRFIQFSLPCIGLVFLIKAIFGFASFLFTWVLFSPLSLPSLVAFVWFWRPLYLPACLALVEANWFPLFVFASKLLSSLFWCYPAFLEPLSLPSSLCLALVQVYNFRKQNSCPECFSQAKLASFGFVRSGLPYLGLVLLSQSRTWLCAPFHLSWVLPAMLKVKAILFLEISPPWLVAERGVCIFLLPQTLFHIIFVLSSPCSYALSWKTVFPCFKAMLVKLEVASSRNGPLCIFYVPDREGRGSHAIFIISSFDCYR